MADVLLVAATEIELCEHPGLACGVGPVEAAAATARELVSNPPSAVVHVGLAGGHGITPGGLVIGRESLYVDLSAEIPVVDRVEPDPDLLEKVRAAAPEMKKKQKQARNSEHNKLYRFSDLWVYIGIYVCIMCVMVSEQIIYSATNIIKIKAFLELLMSCQYSVIAIHCK